MDAWDDWGGWADGNVQQFTNADVSRDVPVSAGAVVNAPASEWWPFANDSVPDYATPVGGAGVSFSPGAWTAAFQGIGSVLQSGLGMADLALRNVRALAAGQPIQSGQSTAAKAGAGANSLLLWVGLGGLALVLLARR